MRHVLLVGLTLLLLTGCGATAPIATAAPDVLVLDAASPATGPRWVVIKAEGLNCTACAAELQSDLEQTAGVSQIETFAPAPYCRFYIEDGGPDVRGLVEELHGRHAALAGYVFVRGG